MKARQNLPLSVKKKPCFWIIVHQLTLQIRLAFKDIKNKFSGDFHYTVGVPNFDLLNNEREHTSLRPT